MTKKTSATNHVVPPYNPWSSYLVEASAGSGKTWQLSRRFLALVMAGADPASILTVTFTKKAAAEMRERIVKDAIDLGRGHEDFANFHEQIKSWAPNATGVRLRTAEETSLAIIERTQTLKITTIDALFLQWCRRYPLETSVSIGGVTLESPWELLSGLELKRLFADAWSKVLASAPTDEANKNLMQSLVANAPGGKLRSLLTAIEPLTESDTFAWYIQLNSGQNGLKLFDAPNDSPNNIADPAEFIAQNASLFTTVISLASNTEKREGGIQAVAQRDFQSLVTNGIINASGDRLNGRTFMKAAKSENRDFLDLSEKLQAWSDHVKLANLNRTAQLLWTLFEARANAAQKLKSDNRAGSFSDAIKGVSLLSCDDSLVGARALAWSGIKHLMLDEFQDTSRLQWLIFEKLALELLAGQSADVQSGPTPSVFIVGDKKQSIYRFREADPEVLDLAKSKLGEHGLQPCNMSKSYRSSKVILDYVNHVFTEGNFISDFPAHAPAKDAPYGSVCLYRLHEEIEPATEVTESEDNAPPSARREKPKFAAREAQVVAEHIKKCLNGDLPVKVFDKATGTWRLPLPKDFAILYANGKQSKVFEDALRERSIPALRSERKGFFNRTEIKDLMALVQWLAWPGDHVALCTILKSPLCGLTDRELQQVIAEGPSEIFPKIKINKPAVYDLLDDIKSQHHGESVAALAGTLLTKYRIADLYLEHFGPVEGPLAKANILKWFDQVRSMSALEAASADSLSLAMDDAVEEDDTGNASLANDAVTLMTIHKSKGLEFPCVIVTGTIDDWHKDDQGWIKDGRPGQEGFWYIGTNTTRPKSSPQLNELLAYSQFESRQEKARLLYVALTRASHHLVISGGTTDDENSFWPVLERAERHLTDLTTTSINLENFADGTLLVGALPNVEPAEKSNNVSETLTPVTMNNSPNTYPALNILTPSSRHRIGSDDVSQEVSEGNLKRASALVSRVPSDLSAAFGTLVHKVLELKIHNQTWTQNRLETYLVSKAERTLSQADIDMLMDAAHSDANQIMTSTQWNSLVHDAERTYTELPMASIDGQQMINAIADVVVFRKDSTLRVIDFKTTPTTESDARSLCEVRGYRDQVNAYCQIVSRALNGAPVTGHILFTNPVVLVDL